MALAQTLGLGDKEITAMLPKTVPANNALFVGLRYFGEPAEQCRKDLKIPYISCEVANKSSQEILDWIKQTGKSKILIHFDLDVLEPTQLKIAVGFDPDGLRIEAVTRIISDVAKNYDLVGLTVAEPMPREVIKLRALLHSLPIF
ncbi:arginase, putative [Trichomonas vaginalis G3]|uniref:Arginase, putative n=1 Tax=Trichomonas vaginalis (strain ATCC PRA-98 / G3) TaxID=412133 RepID=A2ECZ3_TRIV3|nr:arginase family [Trichomonas vaginalis G3]EAY09444.1 arginase, putative [Trichomonas vaginalis G3]KAI5500660.1 arginase family [Trichomonas vaginalis G3]|eukprot:XP_001321667.1 arginase [Trichomonas vaginalis G3]